MIINETEGRAVQQYGRGILCVGGKNSVVQNRDLNILVPYDVLNAEGYELKKKYYFERIFHITMSLKLEIPRTALLARQSS